MKISKIKIPGVQNPIDIKDTTYQFEQVGKELKVGVDGGTKETVYTSDPVIPQYAISTIHINESTSETGSKVTITGDLGKDAVSADTNVIKWIRDNSKLYVGRYAEKEHYLAVCELSTWGETDVDFGEDCKYPINQYMKLPKFWYRCIATSVGCDLQFTHNEDIVDDSWNCWEGDTFIGSYKARAVGDTTTLNDTNDVSDITLVSRYNTKPSTNITWEEFRKITRKMGEGFSMVTYDSHKIMEILFYAWYGDADAQAICGAGASVNDWYSDKGEHLNGRTMDLVDSFTDTDASDDPDNNHFWGLCDWWGNVYEWIDDLQVLGYDSNNQDPDSGNDATRLAILDYYGNPKRVFDDIYYVDDCQTKKHWGKYADVIPTKCEGTDDDYYDTGYTVRGCVDSGFGLVATRSNASASSDGGVGYLYVSDNPDDRDSNSGSRLQYTGPWAEVSELSGQYYAFDDDITTLYINEADADGYNKVSVFTYNDNAVNRIRGNAKLYIGKYNSDYDKMLMKPYSASNTSWIDIDGASLYMKLPEFWYKGYSTEKGGEVKFTMKQEYVDDTWNHWDGKTYIACYKAELAGDSDNIATFKSGGTPNIEDVYFESKPGVKPSTWFSQKQGKEIARNMGKGMSLITYESHKVLEILFYALCGNVDSQAVCGAGAAVNSWDNNSHLNGREQDVITDLGTTTTRIYDGSTTSNIVVGGTSRTAVFGNSATYDGIKYVFDGYQWSNKGLLRTDRDTKASGNPINNHFLGLCDWWGNVWEWVDNLQILGIPTGNEEEAINVGVLDYDGNIERIINVPYNEELTTKKLWGKFADTMPKEGTGDYDEYSDGGYTANGDVGSGFGDVAMRSSGSDDSDGGVGYLYVDYDPGYRASNCGSRLQYHGDVVIVDELEP